MAEYTSGNFDSCVIGVPGFIYPYAGWFIRPAPGLEFEDSETSFLFRAGVGYDFELRQQWSPAPVFNVDIIKSGETKLVYGLSLSFEF